MVLFLKFYFFSIRRRDYSSVSGPRQPRRENKNQKGESMLRVSVDIGGTFTDMVVSDADGNVSTFKAPSTPGQLSRGVMDCLRKAAAGREITLSELLAQVDPIVHGTTVTTNALLTRSGAKAAIITTQGFRDIIELRRGIRIGHSPYNLKVPFPKPIVSRDRIVGVAERVRYNGEVITPLDEVEVEAACR